MGTIANGEIARKPHIMLIAFPAQGHMSPMMQFAKRLASKGTRVTVVAAAIGIVRSSIEEDTTSSINFEYISYKFEDDEIPDGAKSYMGYMKLKVLKSLPGLVEKQKFYGHPVEVLLYDSLLPWGLDLCRELGVRGGPLFTQSCAVCAIYWHTHLGSLRLPVEGLTTVSLSAMPLMAINDLPSSVYDGLYPGLLEILRNQFVNLEKADWIFFNTFDKLEDEVAEWLSSQWPIKTIGPSIPSMFLDKRLADDKDYGLSLFKPDVEACIKWLDAKDVGSVVYVSFGSLVDLGQEYMSELAWGLLNSNNFFLWVVRESEQIKLPSNFCTEAAEKGLVVSWCPQLEVLAHKSVGSFMTHCGWNSTIEALSLGVPMLVMPLWTDQTTNAKFIVDVWQTGVRVKDIDKESVTREDIADCIKEVMNGTKGEELKTNAVKWKELAVEAMSEGGSSDKNIDEFISEIRSITTC